MSDYYPSLFDHGNVTPLKKEEEQVLKPNKKKEIKTMYEENSIPHIPETSNYITIFGSQNLQSLVKIAEKYGEFSRIEYGNNYIRVLYKIVASGNKILATSRVIVNNDIIGIFKESLIIEEGIDVYIKKKGILSRLVEYLIG